MEEKWWFGLVLMGHYKTKFWLIIILVPIMLLCVSLMALEEIFKVLNVIKICFLIFNTCGEYLFHYFIVAFKYSFAEKAFKDNESKNYFIIVCHLTSIVIFQEDQM